MDNIDGKTLKNLKLLAKSYSRLTDTQLMTVVHDGKLIEVLCEA